VTSDPWNTPAKFEFSGETITDEAGRVLHRIRALTDIDIENYKPVKRGDLGGYVQYKNNLNPCGNAWVHDNARVVDNAVVSGDAQVYGNAQVSDQAAVMAQALVGGDARIFGSAVITDQSKVMDNAVIGGNDMLAGDSVSYGGYLRMSAVDRYATNPARVAHGQSTER